MQKDAMARSYELVSADSHVLEPPQLWTDYLPRRFREKAPRVVPDDEGAVAWQFAPDVPPAPIGIYASAGRPHDQVRWTGTHHGCDRPETRRVVTAMFRGVAAEERRRICAANAAALYGLA
jgi:hypothetical protein